MGKAAATVLVTGANGHIGANLVRLLLEHGHEVRPLVRRGSDERGLQGLAVTPWYGDVLDADSIRDAMIGCRTVFHLAAAYRTRVKDEAEIMRPAVEGTRNVFTEAARAGVKRVVHTSSMAAVGLSTTPGVKRDESHWNDEELIPYTRAKVKSERLVYELAREVGIEAVVVCPTMVLGPYDFRITPSTSYFRALFNRAGLTGRLSLNIIDVRDVALGHLLAAERGRAGERYLLGGEELDGRAMGRLIEEITGKRPHHLSLPRWATIFLVGVLERLTRLVGREPASTRDEVAPHASRYACYDLRKARDELGFEARPARATLESAAAWLSEIGALRPAVAAEVTRRLPPGDRIRGLKPSIS